MEVNGRKMGVRAVAGIMTAVFALSPGGAYAGLAAAVSLSAVVKEARERNPRVISARKRWEAARARVPQAKSLEDPQVGVTVEKVPRGSLKLKETMPNDRMLSFAQFLPFFGKLSLKGKIAVVEAQMAGAEYKKAEIDTVNEVKKAYFDLYLNYKEEELFSQNLLFLRGMARTAEAVYASNKGGGQADILKIDLEIARLTTDILNIQQERAAKEARLDYLMGKKPDVPVGVPEAIEENARILPLDDLYKYTLTGQPELLAFQYAIEKNKYAKSLAKKSFFPDFMAQITQRGIASGSLGPWDLMLSFTVPIWFWTKQRYQVKEAIANLAEAEAAYEAMLNQSLAETKEMYVKAKTALNRMDLFRNNVFPLLESSISASLAAFSADGGDFMALLDTERMLVESRMDYYRAVVEYNMAFADLERATGTELREVKK